MGASIHCVRHAQGYHNLGDGHYDLHDPSLTSYGEQQCLNVRDTFFADQSNISLIVASPLQRTLHTAFTIFEKALKSGGNCHPSILALPDAQELSDDSCDTGSDLSDLKKMVVSNGWPVDLDLVKDDWNIKSLQSRYSPSHSAIKVRARDLRALLYLKVRELAEEGSSDITIVLVSHGGLLHYFTDDWEDAARYPGTGWSNCETREYAFQDFIDIGNEGQARLVETSESRSRRGKVGQAPDENQQHKLFTLAMEGWEKQGLQRPDRVCESTMSQQV